VRVLVGSFEARFVNVSVGVRLAVVGVLMLVLHVTVIV
jgi:hypothetical protein